MIVRLLVLTLLMVPIARGISFRIATFNIGAHLVVPTDGSPAYFDYGIGAPGQPDHEKVREVIERIGADVVALQEIHTADVTGDNNNLQTLAESLGYPYRFVPTNTGTFDPSLRNAILSRHPFIRTEAIGSPPGAKEITRLIPSVRVDIPGTENDPLIVSPHLKSGTTSADRFRRAVEMKRITGFFASQAIAASDNFIILGDFNPSSINANFNSLPSGLPGSFLLGPDIAFPVQYFTNPLNYFSGVVPVKLDPRQANNSPSTYDTTTTTGPTLDLFLVSPAIANRPIATEIYNSALDTSNSIGLAKSNQPLPANTSVLASDHYAVFADFELDQNNPSLAVSFSQASIKEGTAAATLSVTLPTSSSVPVTVSLSADSLAALTFASTLEIPAGQLTATLPIDVPRNFTTEGNHPITFSASTSGYSPGSAVLQVIDADAPYQFTAVGQSISETFDGFNGAHDPAPWISTGGMWNGIDDGSSALPGFRSYATTGGGSLGFLSGISTTSVSTHFTNSSNAALTSIQIDLTTKQWRSATGGTIDTLTAELEAGGINHPLTDLTYTIGNLPTSGEKLGKSIISGLRVAPGEDFQLRFTFTPGVGGGPLSKDVFINEFHYDNAGGDSGEFVEIVIGSGFSGDLSSVNVILYNGSGGAHYGSHTLSTFTPGEVTQSGHRIFSKFIPGIENGNPDGIAIAINGAVTQFISYGGSFTATAGAAIGMTSTDIGVKQSTSEIAGQASLGLTGNGEGPGEFTWMKLTGIPHSPGLTNSGQSFTAPPQGQGIALDNLGVTFLADTDLDGLPDISDPDDDNDGLTDTDEALFGCDPLDNQSRYRATLSLISPVLATLSFPTRTGRSYSVESSNDLKNWVRGPSHSGTGTELFVSIDLTSATGSKFYRVAVSYE
jgi:hypothetical protein